MNYNVTVAGKTRTVSIGPDGITLDGAPVVADLTLSQGDWRTGQGVARLEDRAEGIGFAHDSGPGAVPASGGRWQLSFGGRSFDVEVLSERERVIQDMVGATAAARGPQPIKAPMPGLVVKVEVAEGETVERGQGVVVVEAMKMENELRAADSGVVSKVHAAPGQTVEKDQLLVEFSSADEAET